MASRVVFHLEIEIGDSVTSPQDVLDTVVTAAVNLLETLNTELQQSPTDTVPGDVVRAEASRLQAELDKVNAGQTPVPAPTAPADPGAPVPAPSDSTQSL